MKNYKLIGIRIMQKRKECDLTQENLAEKIGLSKNHISNIERGVIIPKIEILLKICEVLGETPDYYLIGRISSQKEDELMKLLSMCPPKNLDLIKKLIETYLNNI